jgi:hypothetical protein
MRSFRSFEMVGALCVLSSAALSGCVPGNGQCRKPVGEYHAAYTVMDGNCNQPLSRDIVLDADADQNTRTTTTTLSDSVTTEINLIGCTIGVKQEIKDSMGLVVKSNLQGELQVMGESASELEGTLQYKEYMPDGATVRCVSNVNASYTLSSNPGAPLGAAAAHALGQVSPPQ